MPDLRLYRRHKPDCPHVSKGQGFINCKCPLWVYGSMNGRPIRKSLKTSHWSAASKVYDQMMSKREVYTAVPVPEAVRRYLRDCEARRLKPSTLISYTSVLEPFGEFCSKRVHDVRNLKREDFTDFRASRVGTAKTQRKEIELLRAFCGFCLEHDWIEKNFAKSLKPPKDDGPVTMHFRNDDIDKMLEACNQIKNWNNALVDRAQLRARALILLLLYSGLRISDAVKLKRSELKEGGNLRLRTMKTGNHVHVQLHADCVEALNALPQESAYFFWSGKGRLSSAIGSARRTITTIGRIAGVKDAHPHRFRDTFSINLLIAGIDIRTVQLLLGHTSIRTTEKHYAPYVKAMQVKLDSATKKLDFSQKDRLNRSTPRHLEPFGAPAKSAPVSRSARPRTPETSSKNGGIDGDTASSENTKDLIWPELVDKSLQSS